MVGDAGDGVHSTHFSHATEWYCVASSQELSLKFSIYSMESSPTFDGNVSLAVQQKLTQILDKCLCVPLQWSLAAVS